MFISLYDEVAEDTNTAAIVTDALADAVKTIVQRYQPLPTLAIDDVGVLPDKVPTEPTTPLFTSKFANCPPVAPAVLI